MTRPTLARRLAAVLTAALTLSLMTVPAGAQYPGANGRIAFARDGDVVSRSVSNETVKVLSEGSDPTYSADGTKIVYMRYPDVGYHWNIWIMNADGTGKRNITKSPSVYETAVFNPSGTKILFSQYTGSATGARRMFLINVDGTNKRRFAPDVGGNLQDGTYSPNGNRIAYIGGSMTRNPSTLRTIRADGDPSTIKVLANVDNSRTPDWSPDGTRIVFSRANYETDITDIIRIDADGTDPVNITEYTAGMYADAPVWAPDGTAILFGGPDGEIWRTTPDGSSKAVFDASGYNYSPAWQPRP